MEPFVHEGGTVVYSINDKSQAVGQTDLLNGQPTAFLYSDQSMFNLSSLVGYEGRSNAYSINNAGQIAGISTASLQEDILHAVVFWQGKIIDIGTLAGPMGNSAAYDINDNYDSAGLGQIVGQSNFLNNNSEGSAFFYTNGNMANIGAIVCPYPEYVQSMAIAINNNGQIVGYCEIAPYSVGFFYDTTTGNYYFIGNKTGSYAADINDAGQIIGMDTNGNATFPFIYTDGVEYNLNDLIQLPSSPHSKIHGFTPVAINDLGQIVGNTYENKIILLTPITE